MNTVGERVRYARQRAGLTQQQLANAIGVTKAAISKLENGSSNSPTPENLFAMAKIMKCSATWLVYGKGEIDEENLTDSDRLLAIHKDRMSTIMGKLSEQHRMLLLETAEKLSNVEEKIGKAVAGH